MKGTQEILRELREEHNFSQGYIAKYLGITQQTYSNYEVGIRETPLRHIVKLSHLYRVSADYLLGISIDYAGNTDLSQEYLGNISLHDFIYNVQQLNPQQKKNLELYMRFLKGQ